MFKDHRVILNMYDTEPRKIHPNNFYLLDILQRERQDLLEKAKSLGSAALKFYQLAKAFKDERNHLIRIDNNNNLPLTKQELKHTRRAAKIYEHFLISEKFFTRQKSRSAYHSTFTQKDFNRTTENDKNGNNKDNSID